MYTEQYWCHMNVLIFSILSANNPLPDFCSDSVGLMLERGNGGVPRLTKKT